jgi:hypothetical protein
LILKGFQEFESLSNCVLQESTTVIFTVVHLI